MTLTQNANGNGASPAIKAQFQAMLAPSSKAVSRKGWGIDYSTVWIPYFTAAKTVGAVDDVDLPDDALGAPFRLRRDKDTNDVKFSASGRPMFFVAPELNALVNRARDNYISGLMQSAAVVQDESPELFSAQVERQQRAAAPILAVDEVDLAAAIVVQQDEMASAAANAAAEVTSEATTEVAPEASSEAASEEAPTPVEETPEPVKAGGRGNRSNRS